MSMYVAIINQFKRTLRQLDHCLEKAQSYAQTRSFDSKVLLAARLAPDQFALARQVQIACDSAKITAARMTGKTAPSHADNEETIDQLRARIGTVLTHLDTYVAADFEEAATRMISNPRWEGKVMLGADYFLEHAVPNFYFHVNHAYAILRHNGVPLGKSDYLGALSLRAP